MSLVLWESFQKARYSYHCDMCHQEISPGEEYRRWLWRISAECFVVMREHMDCEPDGPPDEEGRASLFEDYALPLAA